MPDVAAADDDDYAVGAPAWPRWPQLVSTHYYYCAMFPAIYHTCVSLDMR